VDEIKQTLLIVEDDLDIADMLNAYFRVQGYEILTVNWGEDGVRAAQSSSPDLVILDIRLPDIDGFEVAKRLRNNRKTKAIPIIFLTEKRERSDRLRGLELHADDYITKPFDIQELRLRVRNALKRAQQESLTNVVTGVPEGNLVDEALQNSLAYADAVFQVVSLKNLDSFREAYGFVAADDLLRAVAIMIRDAVRDLGGADSFIGHLATADFVVVTRQANATALKERIRKRLEQSFTYFYNNQLREEGGFTETPLAVQVYELSHKTSEVHDLPQLKAELEYFLRP
jgi:DNA-binding response OmpR family regulator